MKSDIDLALLLPDQKGSFSEPVGEKRALLAHLRREQAARKPFDLVGPLAQWDTGEDQAVEIFTEESPTVWSTDPLSAEEVITGIEEGSQASFERLTHRADGETYPGETSGTAWSRDGWRPDHLGLRAAAVLPAALRRGTPG